MISMDKKYKTRDGRDVRLLCVDGPNERYPVIGIVQGLGFPYNWMSSGNADTADLETSSDLIEVKPRIEGWVNIYTKEAFNPDELVTRLYKTRNEADRWAHKKRIACLHVSFEEGEGL